MSSPNDTNDLPRPIPPSRETPAWQVGLMTGIGAVVSLLVLLAIQQDYRSAIEVGSALVAFGILLAIGLIAESKAISAAAAVGLFAGGIAVLLLGVTRGNALWMTGGLVIFLCGELVLLRERIIRRDA